MGRFSIHSVRWASILGAGLSFLFGGSIVPRLLAIVIWSVRHIPWSRNPPGPFPNPSVLFSSLNIRFGLIWLAYYILAYLWSICRPLHRRFVRYRSLYRSTLREPRASQAWPGEQKWVLVERCYQRFREALARYSPQPLQLKTPPGFYYRIGTQIAWEGGMLVLPEELLTPERIHQLLPLLAHHLAYYNSPDGKLQTAWDCSPSHSPWWMFFTGNFLWLPVWVKWLARWEQWENRRVHDADTFAHYLGEGESLEHYLRRCHSELEQTGRPDNYVPSLVERIGHLEALRKEEHRQMRELGLIPREPPLVKDNPILKLNRGSANR